VRRFGVCSRRYYQGVRHDTRDFFYEGHLPGFSVNTLIKKGLGRPGVDARLEEIFARGIDPDDESHASPRGGVEAWPARHEVRQFADACDQLVEHALLHDEVDRPGVPVLDRAEGVFTLLEHEGMHQETLLYMWHQVPHGDKKRPEGYAPDAAGDPPVQRSVTVPAGAAMLGADRHVARFGWDNEFDAHRVVVPAFEIDAHDVTNAAFLEFVEAGGYDDPRWWGDEDFAWVRRAGLRHPLFWERHDRQWCWRGQFGLLPLPPAWPVYVSHAEASAFARWRGKRLPTEAEFFDGQHYVLKGASPATTHELLRPSFRNWFRPHYPYVYASFRCAGSLP